MVSVRCVPSPATRENSWAARAARRPGLRHVGAGCSWKTASACLPPQEAGARLTRRFQEVGHRGRTLGRICFHCEQCCQAALQKNRQVEVSRESLSKEVQCSVPSSQLLSHGPHGNRCSRGPRVLTAAGADPASQEMGKGSVSTESLISRVTLNFLQLLSLCAEPARAHGTAQRLHKAG